MYCEGLDEEAEAEEREEDADDNYEEDNLICPGDDYTINNFHSVWQS